MKPRRTSLHVMAAAALAAYSVFARPAAAVTVYNAPSPAEVTLRRDAWLADIGVAPQYRVDFEIGFAAGQSVELQPGLLPGGLVIRDFSASATVTVEAAGSPKLGGSLPVGSRALAAGSRQIVLDFSAAPVDYVAFRDIDLFGAIGDPAGASLVFVTEYLGSVASLDPTADSGASAEFVGVVQDLGLRITQITITGGGNFPDLDWGLDDLEYGRFSYVPEPGVAALLALGLAAVAARRSR